MDLSRCREILEQVQLSDSSRKLHNFTLMKLLKNGKDNTSISQSRNIQILGDIYSHQNSN